MKSKLDSAAADRREARSPEKMQRRRMSVVCGICGGQELRLRFEKVDPQEDPYTVYSCARCRSGITVPVPSPEELSRLYSSGSYRANDGTRFNFFAESLVHYFNIGKKKKIKKYRERGNILDVGCGRGTFLDIMKQDGWSVMGVELNEETASYASSRYGIQVLTAGAMPRLADESFDVITLYHVLEHSFEPAAVVKECRRLMRKNGMLVIAVPNMDSLQALFGQTYWFHLDLPFHLHHFTLKSLQSLLQDNSLKIVRVQHFDFEQNVFGWMQTLLNKAGIRRNLLYNLLKRPELRRSELAAARRKDVLLTVLLAPAFFPLSILLALLEAFILKRGGAVYVYAVNR
jgi:2-polyprenyl-3-methyl-5-hydroxy-6-metoxy-1,4-benzoquinol methylase